MYSSVLYFIFYIKIIYNDTVDNIIINTMYKIVYHIFNSLQIWLLYFLRAKFCHKNSQSHVSYSLVAPKRKITRNTKEKKSIRNFIREWSWDGRRKREREKNGAAGTSWLAGETSSSSLRPKLKWFQSGPALQPGPCQLVRQVFPLRMKDIN